MDLREVKCIKVTDTHGEKEREHHSNWSTNIKKMIKMMPKKCVCVPKNRQATPFSHLVTCRCATGESSFTHILTLQDFEIFFNNSSSSYRVCTLYRLTSHLAISVCLHAQHKCTYTHTYTDTHSSTKLYPRPKTKRTRNVNRPLPLSLFLFSFFLISIFSVLHSYID